MVSICRGHGVTHTEECVWCWGLMPQEMSDVMSAGDVM